ncbi:3-beta hydroxysteroid dehydrogenase [Paenibacillus sp. CAA11]|uniref:NAD-dependent epimerase/dehydratase family protein n=1 Tax=Paenibacillus sp. CAA11 TaxID=1532905 RepID=UPI000D354A7D|nr:NAD(P)-dependent oxidoreductase [Paenibacillus sp. CAA11]AWB45633.1 3-beta hydroxysteroid dehydrogenase [Paenibacillus sp. CAA11]
MKVLVTGATGFLGKNLIGRLLREGHEVTGMGRSKVEGERLQQQGARFLQQDLGDELAAEACQGQDAVIHCGALSSPWGDYRDFYRTNVLGTRHMVQGALKHGVGRLINVSTPSIYFEFRDRLDIREDAKLPPRAVNAYAATKLLAEQEADAGAAAGLPVLTIRPRGLFGPGDTAIFPRLLRANEKGFVPLFHQGRAVLDVTYIDNVTEALMCCLAAPSAAFGHKFNITNGEPVMLFGLLEQLFKQLGMPFRYRRLPYSAVQGLAFILETASRLGGGRKEPLLTRYTAGLLAFSQTLNIDKARAMLGYRPIVSLDEGIIRFCNWWEETGKEGQR